VEIKNRLLLTDGFRVLIMKKVFYPVRSPGINTAGPNSLHYRAIYDGQLTGLAGVLTSFYAILVRIR
ncbi:TPA: hypothetical protein ACIA93_001872, partial [Salmonella enterica subsp. enterica serovar Typhimurium]